MVGPTTWYESFAVQVATGPGIFESHFQHVLHHSNSQHLIAANKTDSVTPARLHACEVLFDRKQKVCFAHEPPVPLP